MKTYNYYSTLFLLQNVSITRMNGSKQKKMGSLDSDQAAHNL